jgi:hypothetical protein
MWVHHGGPQCPFKFRPPPAPRAFSPPLEAAGGQTSKGHWGPPWCTHMPIFVSLAFSVLRFCTWKLLWQTNKRTNRQTNKQMEWPTDTAISICFSASRQKHNKNAFPMHGSFRARPVDHPGCRHHSKAHVLPRQSALRPLGSIADNDWHLSALFWATLQ